MVTRATEVMTGRPCFEVEFSDGAVIVADAEHQWLVTVDWEPDCPDNGSDTRSSR